MRPSKDTTAKECQQPREAGRGEEQILPYRDSTSLPTPEPQPSYTDF